MGTWWLALLAGLLLMLPVAGAASSTPGVTVTHADGTLTVTPLVAYDHLSLRVATPDGRLFQAEGSGGPIHFRPFAIADYTPPDGSYLWELHLMPRGALGAEVIERARRGRESGDVEAEQAFSVAASRAMVVQSGGFHIIAGKLVMGDGPEGRRPPRGQSRGTILSPFGPVSFPGDDPILIDFVIADDLIVQGSTCTGLDCINGEDFGFDTLRLKENNTRLQFNDTSSTTGFPTNNWQIRANSSASGGANFLGFVDQGATGFSESGTIVFSVAAGAPANSLFVASTGRVGLRTSTPVLDLHAATSNTPAFRLEQNSAGGFTAQTWDVAGNEASFFIRDVTSGSRLPLRIRPGAPSSSLDIAADGDVGLGTGAPANALDIRRANQPAADIFASMGNDPTAGPSFNFGYAGASFGRSAGFFNMRPDAAAAAPNPSIRFLTANVERIIIDNEGFVGIGSGLNPIHPLQMASGAHVTAGGVWTDVSSREAKDDIQSLTADEARTTLAALEPVKFAYKADPAERHVGFVAEDVPDLVARPDRKTLSPMDIVAVLTRVVQEQQQRIEELTAKLTALEGARGR
jgi:hypothetical protein